MKVTIDGKTHEIDESAIDFEGKVLVDPTNPPSGLFNQDGVNRIVQDAKRGLVNPNTLLENPDHQQKVLSHFGIALDKEGKPKLPQIDDKEQFQAWDTQHAKPLREQIESLDGKMKAFQSSIVQEKVKTLTAQHLKDSANSNTFLINGITATLGYDTESNQVVPLKNGKPILHGNGQVMTADEWFTTETQSGSLKSFVKDNRPGSSNFQSGGSFETSKIITRNTFDSLNASDKHKFLTDGGKVVD